MKYFLVWNISFIFLYQWLIAFLYKSTEEQLRKNIAGQSQTTKQILFAMLQFFRLQLF